MKTLTLWQPWAWLVVAGLKLYETRTWKTNHRGKLLIHAGKTNPKEYLALFSEWDFGLKIDLRKHGMPHKTFVDNINAKAFPLGCIVGSVDVEDCVKAESIYYLSTQEKTFGDFSSGRFAWRLVNPWLGYMQEAKGKQGLWNYEPPSKGGDR